MIEHRKIHQVSGATPQPPAIPTECVRCGADFATAAHTMSMFNTDAICVPCRETERQHPDAALDPGQAVAKGREQTNDVWRVTLHRGRPHWEDRFGQSRSWSPRRDRHAEHADCIDNGSRSPKKAEYLPAFRSLKQKTMLLRTPWSAI